MKNFQMLFGKKVDAHFFLLQKQLVHALIDNT